MRFLAQRFACKVFISAFAFAFVCSVAHAQEGPAPAATWKRPRVVSVAQVRPAVAAVPPAITRFPINVAVAGAAASSFTSDPAFANCTATGHSCNNWMVNPWPFAGMIVDQSSGVISGTPTAAGRVRVQIATMDSDGQSYETNRFVEVTPAQVTVLTTDANLPAYPVGMQVSEYLIAYGVRPAPGTYVWSLGAGSSLPTGVTFDSNGHLSGTASAAGIYKFHVSVTDTSLPAAAGAAATGSSDLDLVIDAAPDCGNAKYSDTSVHYFNGGFPLSKKRNTDPLGNSHMPSQWATENDVQCFYGASGLVSVAGKVQYLYGFGGGANTISADLVSVQMPAPVGAQVSFGSSVTAGGTGTPSSTSTTNQTPSVTSALQAVEAGGNFYIHALYPLGQYTSAHFTVYGYLDPKVGFSFNGFAGQATLSQGSEQYFSFPVETYVSYDGIGHTGGVYFDYRGGLQSVPGSFARSAGLSQHNFMLNQLAVGFNFAGLFRIGAQRFFGPSAAFNASNTAASSFNKWHLVIQLSPKGSS